MNLYELAVAKALSGSGGGGGGGADGTGVLIKTESLGQLSTTSTSATDTGKVVSVSREEMKPYDLMAIICYAGDATNEHHICSIKLAYLLHSYNIGSAPDASLIPNCVNYYMQYEQVRSKQNANSYGVYANSVATSADAFDVPIYMRYNSQNTFTIDGTYTAKVYGFKLYINNVQ